MSSLRNASTSLFRPSAAVSDKTTVNAAAPIGNKLVVKRILHVKISGSLANMTLAGPQAAVWKPLSGKESEVLKPYIGAEVESAEAVNRLRTGTVRKVTLMEHNSSFPVPIGISMNCITPWETTEMGENYAYTVLPKSTLSTPQVVFEADTNEQDSASWKQMYSQYNAANLETEGVMDAPNQPWLFVNKNHPAIGLLQSTMNITRNHTTNVPTIRMALRIRLRVLKTSEASRSMSFSTTPLAALFSSLWRRCVGSRSNRMTWMIRSRTNNVTKLPTNGTVKRGNAVDPPIEEGRRIATGG